MTDAIPTFPLYVSSVEGQPVGRYGSRGLIGAEYAPEGIRYDTKRVVAITADELRLHRRAYDRAIRDKTLTVRSHADFVAALEAEAAPPPAPEVEKLEELEEPETDLADEPTPAP